MRALKALKVNPPKMCQIIGGVLATLGINDAIPLIHGSQGCANFVKHLMSKHFREPIEIATTALNERALAMGGEKRLRRAIENLKGRLDPSLIVVLTTCLVETIGDPLYVEEGVVAVRTPSYSGIHVHGYDRTVAEILKALGRFEERKESLNLITGFVNPGDVEELKRICEPFDIDINYITDLTAIDSPRRKRRGETDVEVLADSANGIATVCFGNEGITGAMVLKEYGVEPMRLRFPIGIKNTDELVRRLARFNGGIPDRVLDMRDRALDGMIDANEVVRGKRVAIFGDPDKVIALAEFSFELGMRVVAVLSPIKTDCFTRDVKVTAKRYDAKVAVFEDSDLYTLHKFLKNSPIHILIGDYRGRYIASEERIPLLRVGFPICDRFGYHRKPMLGYGGALRMAEEIANLLVGGCYG